MVKGASSQLVLVVVLVWLVCAITGCSYVTPGAGTDLTMYGIQESGPQEGGAIEGVAIPVHFFSLVALGVHLFDNLGLEELAQTANELNRWEFMFMASPVAVPNGAGSAINPLAVF